MNGELISKKTRYEFREFLVGWILREIEMEFDAANISCDVDYSPPCNGERRSLVEQYYHSLDFTNPVDIRKLLMAYEGILNKATNNNVSDNQFGNKYKEDMQRKIELLANLLKKDGFKFEDSKIVPITPTAKSIYSDGNTNISISEVTRRNIFEIIDVPWNGRLDEVKFIGRLFDLSALPSNDHRFRNAGEDIFQHRINNFDWDDDWIYFDQRFNFLQGPDQDFLSFLCEMVHPIVRPDTEVVKRLVKLFNDHLAEDGWEIIEKTRISGKPVFAARRRIRESNVPLDAAKSVAFVLDAAYVAQQITRMESAIENDPELAIGTAKEFVETICKTILAKLGETMPSNTPLPTLVKMVREKLDLLPDNIPEKAKGANTIKRLLSNLGTVAQGLAELRGRYGSGHGKHAKVKGLQPRHAKLAVGAASTLGVFLFETYQQRCDEKLEIG